MASRNLGSLTVDLLLKIGGFKQGMDQAARETERAKTRIAKSVQGISSTIAGIGKAFAAIGVGFSVVSIVSSLRESAAAAIEYGDEINKASIKTGIAVETFSELAYAAKQADVSMDSLSTAFKKMQVAVSNAGSGSKQVLTTLTALGLKFEDIKNLSPDRQFELLADRINQLKDPADRTRAAVELFGRAGADLLPLFEQGAAGIRAAREEAVKMGATLSKDQAEALAKADDAIKRLSQSWDGLSRTWVGMIAIPIAEKLDTISNVLVRLNKGAGEHPVFVEAMGRAWDLFLQRSGPIGNMIYLMGLLNDQAKEVAATSIRLSTGTRLPPGGRNRAPFVPGFAGESGGGSSGGGGSSRVAQEAAVSLQSIAQTMKELNDQMEEDTRTSLERQLSEWQEFDDKVAAIVGAGVISVQEGAARIAENNAKFLEPIEITAQKIVPEAKKAYTELSEFAKQAAANMQDAFADFLFDPFSSGLSGMLTGFADTLRRMAANIVASKIFENIGGLFGGTGGGGLGSLFAGLFADGGTIPNGKWGVVGENGPELAFAGSGGMQITPIGMKSMGQGSVKTTNNYVNVPISAPTGSVSRSTQLQISAAVARGIRMADVRDN